ncbi:MAG TPA: hypothetical protein VGS22_06695 [Thermoanaerobaculia bacterium]|jgi:hypothetical protein|nr:hypothetical protein [Thermoanaerobaculia bacterium]
MTDERQLLRHTLATLAYRGGKALRGAPPTFGTFRAAPDSRSAGEILAHICDLFDWATLLVAGRQVWTDGPVLPWEEGCVRFFAGLEAFERALETAEPLAVPEEKLFQGPIADAFTHIGQIAMLRRLAGSPVRGENYFKAEIVTGRVGPDQAAPKRELD